MPKPDEKPTAAAFGQFRSQCARLGIKPTDLDAAFGTKVNARSWRQITAELVIWLKERKKGA